MTICIAATCDNGKQVVVAADRMVTAGIPQLEFEPKITKIEVVDKACAILAAGNLPHADVIISDVRTKVGTAQPAPIEKIGTETHSSYTSLRLNKIDDQIVAAALGKDFKTFRERGGTLPQYLQVQAGIYQNIYLQTQQFNLGVDLLVAGVDSAGAHIMVVTHPGQLIVLQKLGYTAIGSGGQHASTSLHLCGQAVQESLSSTLFAVYNAKRASEVAPGVGKETDMAVISAEGVWRCSEDVLKTLEKTRELHAKKSTPDLKGIENACAEHRKAT